MEKWMDVELKNNWMKSDKKQGLGMITINTEEDYCITLNSKTMEAFEALYAWHNGKGDDAKIIQKGLSVHSISRKHVIKITFTLYTE